MPTKKVCYSLELDIIAREIDIPHGVVFVFVSEKRVNTRNLCCFFRRQRPSTRIAYVQGCASGSRSALPFYALNF